VPEGNLEKVKYGFAALARGDIEEMLTVVHPEIELLPLSGKLVDSRSYHGHEGVREWDRTRRDAWENLEFLPEEYEDLGDAVLVHGEVRSRGAASGVELDTQVSWLFEFREGKVARLEAFLDRDEAHAAAQSPPA
jgi:ketosteroid isomerase-like protein